MIRLHDLTLRLGQKVLLDQVNLTLHPAEKIGVVGHNGAGKSSFFALLAQRLQEDEGHLEIPAAWKLAEVSQQLPNSDDDLTTFVLQGDAPLQEALQALKASEQHNDGHAIANAHAHLQDIGVHHARSRAQALILGLGFSTHDLERKVNTFSGGWQMRLQLARALMSPSDLLLLDEPTNHLDLDAVVWLEKWLSQYTGTLLIISHDKEFLDACTQTTLYIEAGQLTRYRGSYSTFEETKAQQIQLQQSAYVKQQQHIAHLQSFIDRFKAKATKAKQAQSRVKALERMQKIAPIMTASDFSFEFLSSPSCPNPIATFEQTEIGYCDPQTKQIRVIVNNINANVLAGQRIGLLGANGQGKSTWIKTLAGVIPALSAPPTLGKGLRIGYFAQQELDILRKEDSPFEYLLRLAKALDPLAKEQQVRDFLGQFRFSNDQVKQPIEQMSGGEKARLVLAGLVWQRPHLLLLDEPTNHLDFTTRQALAMALHHFEGAVIVVSHDRALLRSVCDSFWLIQHQQLSVFDGDIDDYQRYLLEKSSALESPKNKATSNDTPSSTTLNPAEQRRIQAQKRQALQKKLQPLTTQLQQIETLIDQLSQERETLHQELTQEGLSSSRLADIGKRVKTISTEIDQHEEKWLTLSQEIEHHTQTS